MAEEGYLVDIIWLQTIATEYLKDAFGKIISTRTTYMLQNIYKINVSR
jgi:hypothetical protein